MSGVMSFSTGLRNDRSNAILTRLEDGAGNANIQFYTGTKPSTGGAITDQVLLGTCQMPSPAGSVSGPTFTAGAISDDISADATGTCTWCRVTSCQSAFVMDLDVTDTNGAGPCKLTSTSIIQGGKITIASFTITEGNA